MADKINIEELEAYYSECFDQIRDHSEIARIHDFSREKDYTWDELLEAGQTGDFEMIDILMLYRFNDDTQRRTSVQLTPADFTNSEVPITRESITDTLIDAAAMKHLKEKYPDFY